MYLQKNGRPARLPRKARSISDLSSHDFDLTPPGFAVEPLLLRAASRFGWLAFSGYPGHALNNLAQSSQCFFPVFLLTAVFLRLDNDDAFRGDALISQFQQSFFINIW